MTSKLNALAATYRLVSAPGNFASVAEYCEQSNTDGVAVTIATMNAAMSSGIEEFYSPVFPRGARFSTAEEVRDADLDVQRVRVTSAPNAGEPEMIVSGHAGTRALLAKQFPSAVVVEGNVTAGDVTDKIVVGTLPPHLVAATAAYVYVGIAGFDYAKDGDLAGEELRKRLRVSPAVCVTVE